MADFDKDLDEAPTSYTSTTPGSTTIGRKGIVSDGAGVGRRKEAVAQIGRAHV